jgi:hypothetical protein
MQETGLGRSDPRRATWRIRPEHGTDPRRESDYKLKALNEKLRNLPVRYPMSSPLAGN